MDVPLQDRESLQLCRTYYVSILVLMDVPLQDMTGQKITDRAKVSILVLMDVPLQEKAGTVKRRLDLLFQSLF